MKLKNIVNYSFIIMMMTLGQSALAGSVEVAATVQGKEISEAKLQTSIDYYMQTQGGDIAELRDPNRYKKIRKNVLDVLIGQQLLWGAAQKDSVIAQDDEVKTAFDEYQAQFENSEQFTLKLTESGFNEESFQENLKQQMSAKKWLQEKVISTITVTETEIHEFYQQNESRFKHPEQVRTRHILTKVSLEATEVEMQKAMIRMTVIKQELDSGVDFETLAKQKSEDSSAVKGGDLGYFERGGLVKSYEDVAFILAPGETSDVFQSSFGLHIVKMIDKKPAVNKSESDVKDRIAAFILKDKADLAVDERIISLKLAATIEINML
jgi:peptidyl-prolyl cis-trans isomerase C